MNTKELRINYFKNRKNDLSLTRDQRLYAKLRYNQLKNGIYKIVDIPNREMYRPRNDREAESNHSYLTISKNQDGEFSLKRLTHIYIYDPIRKTKLDQGLIKEIKFECFDKPSGVHDTTTRFKRYGNKITDSDFINPRNITLKEYKQLIRKGLIQ